MINILTSEQEAKIPEFINKWVNMTSGKTDAVASNKIVTEMYRSMGKEPPSILHFTSPLICLLAFSFTKKMLRSQLRSQLCSYLGPMHFTTQLYSQLRSQFHLQLGPRLDLRLDNHLSSQVSSPLNSQLESQLGLQLYSHLDSQLGTGLDSQLESLFDSQLHSQLDLQLRSQLSSRFQSHYTPVWGLSWAVYYDFCKHIGVKFNKDKLRLFTAFVSNIHFCLPYNKLFIYSDKPTKIHWKNRLLHNEKGKAVEYADGWGWYCLNGIPMRPDYVTAPAHQITPEMVLKERNVDMRRELLRKAGVFRMKEHGKLIEKVGDYELRDMSPVFTGIPYAPHLLMRNPSVEDTWHLEGVHPDCHTVQQALNWRAGNIEINWSPAQLN